MQNSLPIHVSTNKQLSLFEKAIESTPLEVREEINTSIYVKIFQFLKEKEILSNNGLLLNLSLQPPSLNPIQYERLNMILDKKLTLKGRHNTFNVSFTLRELFLFGNIKNIELVGSAVFWVLGKEYMKRVVERLEIETLMPDNFFDEFEQEPIDIDFRVFVFDPTIYKNILCSFLADKAFEEKKKETHLGLIEKTGFSKLVDVNEEGNYFSIISFNTEEVSIDFTFIKCLVRKNLFEHDALKIGFECTTHYLKADLSSNSESIFTPLIFRLTKHLNANEPKTINSDGALRLICYLSKGWWYSSENVEKALTFKFFTCSNPYHLLKKALINHFPNNPLAPLFVYFNLYTFIPPSNKAEIKNYAINFNQEYSTKYGESWIPENNAFYKALSLIKNEKDFDLLNIYLQLFVSKNRVKINIKGENWLQFRFESLYISIKQNLLSSLSSFESTYLNNKFFFEETFESLILPSLKQNLEIEECEQQKISQYAFQFLENEDLILKQAGFYLLSQVSLKERTLTFLPILFTHLVLIVKSKIKISLKKEYLSVFISLLPPNQKAIELLHEILLNENNDDNQFVKDLCLASSAIDLTFISPLIFQQVFSLWEKETFSITESLQLAKCIYPHSQKDAANIITSLNITQKEEALCLDQLELFMKLTLQKEAIYSLLKPFFDLLYKSYSPIDTKFLFPFAKIVIPLIDKLETLKNPPKVEEINPFILIAKEVLKHDVTLATTIFMQLEKKKAISSSLKHIESADAKALVILEQNIEMPLSNFKNHEAVHKRLSLLLSSFTKDLSTSLEKQITRSIYQLLSGYLKIKSTLANSLKTLLTPKCNYFFDTLLEDALFYPVQEQEEILNFYFKIRALNHFKALLKMNETTYLVPLLNSLLRGLKDAHVWMELIVRESLLNEENLKEEELPLCIYLSLLAIKKEKFIIAEKYLKVLLNHLSNTNKDPTEEITSLIKSFLALNFSKGRYEILFNFLTEIKSRFPSIEIPDSHLYFQKINAYFIKLNNPLVIETAYETLFKNLSFEAVLPLLEILSESYSKNFLIFLDDEYFKHFLNHQKEDTLLIFMRGFLNLLNHPDKKIEKHLVSKVFYAHKYLEQSANSLNCFTDQKKLLLDLKFVQGFAEIVDDKFHPIVWNKLEILSASENFERIEEVFLFYSKAYRTLDKFDSITLQKRPLHIFNALLSKASESNCVLFLDDILESDTLTLLGHKLLFTLEILKETKNQQLSPKKPSYIPFKQGLKKLLNGYLKLKDWGIVCILNTPYYFSTNEYHQFNELASTALFKNPKTILNNRTIFGAIDIYCGTLLTPFESEVSKETNIKELVRHLMDLYFNPDNRDFYFHTIFAIGRALTAYFDDKNEYLEFISKFEKETPYSYLNYNGTKRDFPGKNHGEIMKNKCYTFLMELVKFTCSYVLIDKGEIQQFMTICINNLMTLKLLLILFPTKAHEILPLLMDLLYSSFVLSTPEFLAFRKITLHITATLCKVSANNLTKDYIFRVGIYYFAIPENVAKLHSAPSLLLNELGYYVKSARTESQFAIALFFLKTYKNYLTKSEHLTKYTVIYKQLVANYKNYFPKNNDLEKFEQITFYNLQSPKSL